MQFLKLLAIITAIVCFVGSAGSIEAAWEDNNDKYFFMYAALMICSMGGFIYLVN